MKTPHPQHSYFVRIGMFLGYIKIVDTPTPDDPRPKLPGTGTVPVSTGTYF